MKELKSLHGLFFYNTGMVADPKLCITLISLESPAPCSVVCSLDVFWEINNYNISILIRSRIMQ